MKLSLAISTLLCSVVLTMLPCITISICAQDRKPSSKPRFYALDESRFQILYVDQNEQSNDWVIPIEFGCRDLQQVAENRLLLGVGAGEAGFREYDLTTRKIVREVKDAKYAAGSTTALRLPDGRTLISAAHNPNDFYIIDAGDNETAHFSISGLNTVRCTRLTPRGTILFGSNEEHVYETTLDGKILRDIRIPGAKHVYCCIEKEDGNLLASTGYSGFIAEIDKAGNIVKTWGNKPNGEPDSRFHFFASVQLLKNGNLFVANWTGHGAKDSDKCPQIYEFDEQGNIVWAWHDPIRAGSIHNAIMLETD